MSGAFQTVYSQTYDLLYKDKDYAAECDLIAETFKSYGSFPVQSVLDLGCGTGNHAIPLAGRGYRVCGVDRSAAMLSEAQRKAAAFGSPSVEFAVGDIRNLAIDQSFDAATMMFAVLGYQTENADVLAALRSARTHLKPGGLLLTDFWYGPAVLALQPGDRVRLIRNGDDSVLRVSSGELESRRHLCHVRFHVWKMHGKQIAEEVEETHPMRYFFPLEIELFLELSGFRLLRLGCFPDLHQDPDHRSWNAMAVASAI